MYGPPIAWCAGRRERGWPGRTLSVKTSSSSGLDRVDYRLLKVLPPTLQTYLLDIFNNLFCCSVFPTQWSHGSLVHLIPKPNNNSVCPISLTFCLLKIMDDL
ncbi:hypothetical protein ALC60_07285 [Trachymyrmex zeteki]|uniref:RNA-directed DNA polymerase from mobile element jockey n=1 Tax=Mycetomoellerius zeteki TaxID=64791 RepID=A0A151X0E1_9HYME|nr:hypothetical protein ALC60_07285 [Trachymyrmex zeteki]